MDACVLTCAMSGVAANRDQCPAIPYTPEDYAAEARRARDAGASVLHVHARYPDGTPSYRVEEYRAITEAMLAETPDMIVNYSTGAVGIPMAERVHHITELKPELGALNMGSMNYAKYSGKRKQLVFDLVFSNPFSDIIHLLQQMNSVSVKPECECFDTGHVGNVYPLLDMGLLQPPVQFSLILGVLGGGPASAGDPGTHGHSPSRVEHLGSDRHKPGAMEAGIGSRLARRERARRARRQLLPSDRRDGVFER